PTQIGGLQAPRVAFSSDGVSSSSAADVNGDGKSDLIIEGTLPEAGLSHLFVLLGRGDGTFRDPIDLGSHNDPVVAIADVTGDGKPDIVTSVMVLLGNGDGTFRDGPAFNADFRYAGSVAVGDFNGDGKPDLAGLIPGNPGGPSNGVSVVFGNGDGSFGPPSVAGDHP